MIHRYYTRHEPQLKERQTIVDRLVGRSVQARCQSF